MPSREQLYVALHSGTPGDVAFYRRACRGARSVLELGCGDGRVLSRLGEPARSRVGLDCDPGMLALARERPALRPAPKRPPGRSTSGHDSGGQGGRIPRPRWVLGDMADFAFRRRFDAILLPFAGFFCLSPRDKRRCLERVRAHLTTRGVFILDAYAGGELRPSDAERRRPTRQEPLVDEFSWVARVRQGEEHHDVFERDTWWPSRQRLDVHYRFQGEGGEIVGRSSIRHWYLFIEQAEALLADAGFSTQRRALSPRVPLEQQWALVATLPRAR